MTTQAPNPRDFKTWEDAFQYPVPVVRRLEQQLRGSINENSDKLRTLVGTSYRDLLSTAERITSMDEQMHEAEDLLGEIGQKCNARAIEKIALNHAQTVKSQRDRTGQRNALASTLSLLQSCMTVGGRLVKRGGSPLLAAKLFVLARLLHSSASKSPDPPPFLDILRTRLASLRRKVLHHIDRILASDKVERNVLIEALAAFSLATTSTPTDVLRHFLNTRAEVLTELLEEPTDDGVHSAMSLLLSTLKEAQMIFPRRLAELLATLQDEPLLQSDAVRATPELNLDMYERWIADDVRNFTPYLRHDQLDASQATKLVQSWAKVAKKTLLEGLRNLLGNIKDAPKVVTLRKGIILRSLSADRRLPGLDQSGFFEDLRSCFVDGLQRIAVDTAQDLITVVHRFLADDISNGESSALVNLTDIWDPISADIDLSKGAVEFRSLIINSSQGKNSRLQSLDRSMTSWSSQMAGLSATIKGMREDRWDDDLDLDLDDDLELDSPQDTLAKEDPKSLQSLLNEQKQKALSSVYEDIQSTIVGENKSNHNAAFLLRVLREVVQHSTAGDDSSAMSVKPPSSLLDALYNQLARQVIDQSTADDKATKWIPLLRRPPAVSLWEGSPAVPVQPSPACFRFLLETCNSMKEIGGDLWTPSAVSALKSRLREMVASSVEKTITKNGKTNGESAASEEKTDVDADTVDESKDSADGQHQQQKTIQTFYDVSYLDKVLSINGEHEMTEFEKVLKQLKEESKLEESGCERIRKSSSDHFRRTYLLFGLLAA